MPPGVPRLHCSCVSALRLPCGPDSPASPITSLQVWLEQIVPVPQAQHGVTVTLQVVCAWQEKAVAQGDRHA